MNSSGGAGSKRISRLAGFIALVLAMCVPIPEAAGQSFAQAMTDEQTAAPYFISPPSPESLANILFAPRYRNAGAQVSLNQNDSGGSSPPPDLFAMKIQFEFDSTRILVDSLPMLESLGQMLQIEEYASEAIVIEGHTDAKGSELYNQGLSERRAEAIRDYLVASFNVLPERLVPVGRGETALYDGTNPVNPVNRRAVFRPLNSVQVQ